MLKIKPGSKFKADLKRYKHDKSTIRILDEIIRLLAKRESLAEKYRDHPLAGKWRPARECHLKPDVLLIYRIDNDKKMLQLVRMGSHSDLFN